MAFLYIRFFAALLPLPLLPARPGPPSDPSERPSSDPFAPPRVRPIRSLAIRSSVEVRSELPTERGSRPQYSASDPKQSDPGTSTVELEPGRRPRGSLALAVSCRGRPRCRFLRVRSSVVCPGPRHHTRALVRVNPKPIGAYPTPLTLGVYAGTGTGTITPMPQRLRHAASPPAKGA